MVLVEDPLSFLFEAESSPNWLGTHDLNLPSAHHHALQDILFLIQPPHHLQADGVLDLLRRVETCSGGFGRSASVK